MLKSCRRRRLKIAIDGPSGAGKSTVGKTLAKRLGYTYIDTGAMYRAVALLAKRRGGLPEGDEALYAWTFALRISFTATDRENRIFCDEEDITEAIRSPEMSLLASDISKRKGVRDALVAKQRELGREGGVVLEGRDIGTVVFPDAEVKFYLDAKPEERARRRFEELQERRVEVRFNETLEEVLKRDHNDMSRAISPLRKAEDAMVLDSTERSVENVVEEMAKVVAVKENEVVHC